MATRCVKCERESRNPKICSGCGICKIHSSCGCKYCDHCALQKPPKDLCPKCGYCKEYHTSKILPANEFMFRNCEYNNGLRPKPTFILNPLQRSLGVEVELGDFKGFVNQSRGANSGKLQYHFDHDGSVVGSGRELVTDKLEGDQYLYGITWLIAQLKTYGCTENDSCGYHVHVDAIDFNAAALRRILAAYSLVQDQLYGTLIARSRKTSTWGKTYCPPLAISREDLLHLLNEDESEIHTWFNKYLYKVNYPSEALRQSDPQQYKYIMEDIKQRLIEAKKHKYENSARRSALNFHSWMMRGTLEFRLKEGTTDPTDLLMWPLWCGWFVEKVATLPDKEIMYWFKQPPTLVELAEQWKVPALQKYVVAKVAAGAKSPKEEPRSEVGGPTGINPYANSEFREWLNITTLDSLRNANAVTYDLGIGGTLTNAAPNNNNRT